MSVRESLTEHAALSEQPTDSSSALSTKSWKTAQAQDRKIVTSSQQWRALALLSLAELLMLAPWFSASAVLPALEREWHLGDAAKAGMTAAVQLGFILGTLFSAVLNLPDVFSPRAVMVVSAVLAATANGMLGLWAGNSASALGLRAATGFFLAGVYPPAMKVAATYFRQGRGLAIGILIGALTVGSACPHLIRGLTNLPWRETLLVASGLTLAGGAIVLLFVGEGPYRFPSARFDVRMAAAVFRERGARLACFGYLGHMWELYAMWAWIGVFLFESLRAQHADGYLGVNASTATFFVIAIGALGCYFGGLASDAWGRTTLTIAAMGLSGLSAVLIGLTFGGPPWLTLLVAAVWGISIIADSAQFSTAVTELSPAAYVGTALTTQTCAGFALTMASIWMIPVMVHWLTWRWAFAMLAPGPAFGVAAMARLRTLPEASKLAGGRR
jgi:MFS family permease